MKLSKKDRLNYANQFKILAALYPNDANYYNQRITALEYGFELNYDWIFESLSDVEMSEEECQEVLDILSMYRSITFSYMKLNKEEKALFDINDILFHGFDGNNETNQFLYAKYFINDLKRFQELKKSEYDDFNSHYESLIEYRRMINIWMNLNDKNNLSIEDLHKLVDKPWR